MNPTRDRCLSRTALDRLLLRLGQEPGQAAREYEAMRHALLVFFDLRGAADSAALADEAIDRLARRLEQGEDVTHVRAYLYGIARNVALESMKQSGRDRTAIKAHRALAAVPGTADQVEARVACLERCLRKLPENSRALIVSYYQGRGRSHLQERKSVAQRFGISYTSLKTRAHRIRNALEVCLRECLEAAGVGNE